MAMKQTRYGLLTAVLVSLALMLAGCGGDDGGLSTEDMARLAAAEDATAAAQAAAAAATAEAMTAHEEAEEAKAEAAAAHEEAEAADAAAAAAQAEAEAAKAAADEAMTMDDMMAADDDVTLADLYEELAGMKIEEDLRMRVGTEGPVSTTVLKAAIEATAEAYHVDATSAIEYIEDNYPTFEVLQRAAVETILEVLHMDNDHLSATAMTAEMVLRGEKGDTGETGSADPDVIAALQEQIDAKADSAAAARPPMPEGAKVLAAGDADLSDMPDYYDPDMIMGAMTNDTAKAAKGTYTGKADIGFAGLNALQAGGDGANVFGSWLEYSHWGYIMGEDETMAAFSLGMPTGVNPVPQDDDKLNATWKGTMTGAWKATEKAGATPAAAATPIVEADQKYVTVRGDAIIGIAFSSTGTGYRTTADLEIKNLVQADGMKLGNFRTGVIDSDAAATFTGSDGSAGIAVANYDGSEPVNLATHNNGYDNAWNGMLIGGGDFKRNSVSAVTNDAGVTAALTVRGRRDPANKDNYLAGRFYGTDGMEVGGVFMENGQVSGYDADRGMADKFFETGDTPVAVDRFGTLVGAFGAAREIPELP